MKHEEIKELTAKSVDAVYGSAGVTKEVYPSIAILGALIEIQGQLERIADALEGGRGKE